MRLINVAKTIGKAYIGGVLCAMIYYVATMLVMPTTRVLGHISGIWPQTFYCAATDMGVYQCSPQEALARRSIWEYFIHYDLYSMVTLKETIKLAMIMGIGWGMVFLGVKMIVGGLRR